MRQGLHFFLNGVLLPALVFGGVVAAVGQITPEQFRKYLTEKAGFEAADLNALDAGETVVKLLPVNDKRQIATCGVVRLQNAPQVSMAAFRESLSQKDNSSKMSSGEFGSPAILADLNTLELRDKDINDLKKCEVGKCDVKLSAALIKRFQAEVDWYSPEHGGRAAQLYKQILSDYVNDYLSRGDAALMQYDSRKVPVHLEEEYRKALDYALFVHEIAPEFVRYLRDFPKSQMPGVENIIGWSNISFGLDPVIAVTHSSNYSSQTPKNTFILTAAKQIYSSRYLDSSLAFTMLIAFPVNGGTDSYLVFTDLSRSNVLGGAFSGLKRSLVENEAEERVADMLSRTKMRLMAGTSSKVELSPEAEETALFERIWNLGKQRWVRVFLLLSLLAIAFMLYREWRQFSQLRRDA